MLRARAYIPRSPAHKPAKALTNARRGSSSFEAASVAAVMVAPSSEMNAPKIIAAIRNSAPYSFMEGIDVTGLLDCRQGGHMLQRGRCESEFRRNADSDLVAEQPNDRVMMNCMAGAISEFPADVRLECGRSGTAVAYAVDYCALVYESFVRVTLQNPQDVAGRDAAVGNFTLQPDIPFPRIVIYFAALQSSHKALEMFDDVAIVLTDRGVEWSARNLRVSVIIQVK